MNSMHYPPRDSIPGLHSISPSELSRLNAYSVSHHQNQHSHGAQSSCPVHGHETTHQHEERNTRPPIGGVPFELPAHLTRELHSLHAQHPRLREELQFLHGRHFQERKEHAASQHAFEEDLRRRGIDYRWAGLPPHLLDEQYRRHLLNSGHAEHSPPFKEPIHGKMLFPPFHFGRNEHPLHIDPYLPPHGLPNQTDIHRRHALSSISPRILDYHRRERNERAISEYEKERRISDERREKEQSEYNLLLNERRKHDENIDSQKWNGKPTSHERPPISESHVNHKPSSVSPKLPIIKGLDYNPKRNDSAPPPTPTIDQTKLPDPKTELAAASILANMNRMNHSPCSEEISHITRSPLQETPSAEKVTVKTEFPSNDEDEDSEPSEEKENYMMTLGLVSQNRKRALVEDIERKRWERKMRKLRGRPKKRTKREPTKESTTEEGSVGSDVRSSSELDFYNGPMTRHKQQLLQEQENLLEQIQKRNSTDDINDVNDDIIKKDNENNNNIEKSNKSSPSSPTEEVEKSIKPSLIDSMKKSYSNEQKRTPSSVDLSSSQPSSVIDHTSSGPPTTSITSHTDMKDPMHQKRLINMIRDNLPSHNTYTADVKQYEHMHSSLDQTKMNIQSELQKHPIELAKHFNTRRHRDLAEDIKFLDNSLFGRHRENPNESFSGWAGIEPLAHAYTSYMSEYDVQRQHVLQAFDELQRESRCLRQKQEYLEKDNIVYNERSKHIAEKRNEMTNSMNAINRALHAIANM